MGMCVQGEEDVPGWLWRWSGKPLCRDSPNLLRILLQKLICKLLLWHVLGPLPASFQKESIWWNESLWRWNQKIWMKSQLCNSENHLTCLSPHSQFWKLGREMLLLPPRRWQQVFERAWLSAEAQRWHCHRHCLYVHNVSLSEMSGLYERTYCMRPVFAQSENLPSKQSRSNYIRWLTQIVPEWGDTKQKQERNKYITFGIR